MFCNAQSAQVPFYGVSSGKTSDYQSFQKIEEAKKASSPAFECTVSNRDDEEFVASHLPQSFEGYLGSYCRLSTMTEEIFSLETRL